MDIKNYFEMPFDSPIEIIAAKEIVFEKNTTVDGEKVEDKIQVSTTTRLENLRGEYVVDVFESYPKLILRKWKIIIDGDKNIDLQVDSIAEIDSGEDGVNYIIYNSEGDETELEILNFFNGLLLYNKKQNVSIFVKTELRKMLLLKTDSTRVETRKQSHADLPQCRLAQQRKKDCLFGAPQTYKYPLARNLKGHEQEHGEIDAQSRHSGVNNIGITFENVNQRLRQDHSEYPEQGGVCHRYPHTEADRLPHPSVLLCPIIVARNRL